MKRRLLWCLFLALPSLGCTFSMLPGPPAETTPPPPTATVPLTTTDTVTLPPTAETATGTATETLPVTETASPPPTGTSHPVVASLPARVTADRLSCRYGPGPEYLYLFAFRAGANIELIGRVDAGNWSWVLVKNQVPCWISANYIDVQGEIRHLPVMYPDGAKLPITPYYPPSEVQSARRNPVTHEVTVSWAEIPVSAGDYEDDSMQTYIIEVWRCEGGQLIFEPLATRLTFISFTDEPGCDQASHGRVWVQEKHGYAGPAEIPWPE